MRLNRAHALVLVIVASCAGAGARHFKEGERLRGAGRLDEAEKEYQTALEKEPANPKYQARLSGVQEELDGEVDKLLAAARDQEKAGDFEKAAGMYAKAVAIRPRHEEARARRELSAAKAKNLGPGDWYRAVASIKQKFPENRTVGKALEGAKTSAYAYHRDQAKSLLAADQASEALTHYRNAKEIDSATPGLDSDFVTRAEALDVAEQGDLRMDAGDPAGAAELYQKALERSKDAEIEAKLKKARGAAGPLLAKLDAARDRAKKGDLLGAVKMYDALLAQKGASDSVRAEAKDIRARAMADQLGAARAAMDRGDVPTGAKRVIEAVRLTELANRGAIEAAIGKIESKPKEGLDAVESASPPDDVMKAARALAEAAAKKLLATAKSAAARDPTKALALLAEIASFSDVIDEIATFRKELLSKSFTGLLDAAKEAGERGNDAEAASLLQSALKATKVPEPMVGPMNDGCKALTNKQPFEAEKSFAKALAAAPRSKLAEAALEIARIRKGAAERDALEVLRSGKGDRELAVGALVASLASDPGSSAAKEGSAILKAAAEKAGPSASDKDLAALLRGASRLAGESDAAFTRGLTELEAGQHAKAEASFSNAAGPFADLAKDIARQKSMATLKSGVKSVDDEPAARALAKLLAADPNDSDAKKALASLISRAEERAKAKDDRGAAKALRLATIATSPAPGLLATLEKATNALEAGDVVEAERKYGEATDLEADHAVAKPALELARSMRATALETALNAYEKSPSEILPLRTLFEKSFALDPMGDTTKNAYLQMLETASRLARRDLGPTAALLDTANTVTKPDQVKAAIRAANASLSNKDAKAAMDAYAKVLEGAKSKVAETGLSIAKEKVEGTQKSSLSELEKGADVDKGADAAAEILKADPTNVEARRAIDKVIERAKEADQKGDLAGAVRFLRAANRARGSDAKVEEGLALIEKNELEKADESLAGISDDPVATVGAQMAHRRRTKALEAGLSGDDKAAAENIKKLLASDPNHKEAKRALEGMLSRADAAAKKGDVEGAANAIEAAKLATSPSGTLLEKLDAGLERLRAKDFASSELELKGAVEASKDSRVAQSAFTIAKGRRLAEENLALAAIAKEDPIPHAKKLVDSLKLENKGYGPVTKALGICQKNAETFAAKGDDGGTGRNLEAAAVLEGIGFETIAQAAQKLAAGNHADAEAEFKAANEGAASTTAALGQRLARMRRITKLKEALDTAKKEGNAAKTHTLVGQILELSPDDKAVKGLAGGASKDLVERRAAAAKAHLDAGRWGLAHFEYSRALELDANHATSKAGLEAVEKELSEKLDLIVVVERVTKKAGGCLEIEGALGKQLMAAGSERSDLGGYILGAKWTEAVEKKVEGAPAPGAGLGATVTSCKVAPATGKIELDWVIKAPKDNATELASGQLSEELPVGLVPRDEQDAKGEHAQRVLLERATTKLLDAIVEQKDKIVLWPLLVAEHFVAKNDAVQAADAFAKLSMRKRQAYDVDRAKAIRAFLEKTYE
ncbi:MAG: hypothetical protein HY791_17060 [Deltaproteobacteria bacterium]|nr:hypothetical protein [Deltaproteobacteria bacterium]